jgi:predicted RNA binding protein YcfA (HicA-like mRNA interferase family)
VSVLPRVSGREVVRALQKIRYERDRQRGGHIVLRQTAPPHRRITVPGHKGLMTSSGSLSIAIVDGRGLVTNNERHFERIEGLNIDNWLK